MEQTKRNRSGDDAPAGAYAGALHWVAVATVVATFPLIFMGGLVTSHQAGLSVPDWPNSFGYNMFALPLNRWVGGVFYEHSHRLLGTISGFCAILLVAQAFGWAREAGSRRKWARAAQVWGSLGLVALVGTMIVAKTTPSFPARPVTQVGVGLVALALVCAAIWTGRRREPRAVVRWLSAGVLAAVIVQGILGGLRVVLTNLDLAIIHACFAQAFFCLAAAVAVMTGRWWIDAKPGVDAPAMRTIFRLALIGVAVVYGQLVVGAVMRHYQAGLAIPDFPLSYGKLLPPTSESALPAINAARMGDGGLSTVTLGQIWIHFGHRIGAVVVTAVLGVLIWAGLKRGSGRGAIVRPAGALIVLLLLQLTLGALTVLWRKPADIASSHVAVGALVLLTTFVLAMRSGRLATGRAVMAAQSPGDDGAFDGPQPVGCA